MNDVSWDSVSGYVQDWYNGLIDAASAFAVLNVDIEMAVKARQMAQEVLGLSSTHSEYGFPYIVPRRVEERSIVGLGEYSDSVCRSLEDVYEKLWAFMYRYEDAHWELANSGEGDALGYSNYEEAFHPINEQLRNLKAFNGRAVVPRAQSWRTELTETVPSSYLDDSGFNRANSRGYSAARLAIGLYREGIPADWLGAFMAWDGPSFGLKERVIAAYREGVPAEYMVNLL